MAFAVVVALAGVGLMAAIVLSLRRGERRGVDEFLAALPLGLRTEEGGEKGDPGAPGPDGTPPADLSELAGLAGRAAELAGQVVERVDHRHSLGRSLERARIPMRPGEYVIVAAAAGLGAAALLLAVTGSVLVAPVGPVAAAVVSSQLIRRRVTRRRKAFEAQLPDALGLVASSLSAGHTFLRAIQMMCEEAGPPMSEEFALVVAETRLGDPLVDALERMAERIQVRDMDMVVQAVRIQQSVGGRLATLLHTLSDFIRLRAELRREVMILTAEGRMSAYVLAGLVPFLFVMMNVLNPTYVRPLYSGWGLILLAACSLSVLAGLFSILRMVRIDV
ncbi:MAG TPA: type II secretion system F family protein [Acidimicrobiales bacterium]|nr:type II secretion system F family protein [Acidimicrobiales bacterium]